MKRIGTKTFMRFSVQIWAGEGRCRAGCGKFSGMGNQHSLQKNSLLQTQIPWPQPSWGCVLQDSVGQSTSRPRTLQPLFAFTTPSGQLALEEAWCPAWGHQAWRKS